LKPGLGTNRPASLPANLDDLGASTEFI